MATTAQPAVQLPPLLIEPSERLRGSDELVRERVYNAVGTHVLEVMGHPETQKKTRTIGQEVLDAAIEVVVRMAIKEGYFRLPGGFGSFKVLLLGAGKKRLPNGTIVDLAENRSRLKYEEGAAVRELLGMPYKTSYRRKYARHSKLTQAASKAAFRPLKPQRKNAKPVAQQTRVGRRRRA